MFHIVFNADENYIKYTAVLINSIVKNTDKNKKFKEFFTENLATNSTEILSANSATGGGIAKI